MTHRLGSLALALTLVAGLAAAQVARSQAPEGAAVYIISPKDGETVDRTFTVQFGLKGMGVAPAGVTLPNTGHHHLLIDVAKTPDLNVALPATDNIRHYGLGQTETELTLPPGRHTLQLVLGDSMHVPHEKPLVSDVVTVIVK